MGFAEPLCARITYVGELGYELYVPVEQAVHVHSLVTEAGESYGLQHAVPRGTTVAASLTTAAASLTTAAASLTTAAAARGTTTARGTTAAASEALGNH